MDSFSLDFMMIIGEYSILEQANISVIFIQLTPERVAMIILIKISSAFLIMNQG